ncbi:MAG TPA: cadherin-like beta sandwich domain-containing protein [Pseudomonadales bacterium]
MSGAAARGRCCYLLLALLLALAGCGSKDDEGLEDLQISAGELEPPFEPDVFEYTAEVPNDVTSLTVTATAEDSGSTIEVNGTPVDSGAAGPPIALAVGETTITIAVIAEDGDEETYTLRVTRLPPPSDNPALAELTLTAAPLDQIFDGEITSYTASTGFFGVSTRVIAVPEEPRATLELEGEPLDAGEPSAPVPLAVGENRIELEVTAEDGSQSRTYEVTVERAGRDTVRQEGYVKASNTGPDAFGASVAISGDTLAVGAPGEASAASGIDGDQDDDSLSDAGAVYVFDRAGTTWAQSAYVKASNPGDPDLFGGAVALDGDRLLVGAEGEQSLAAGVDGDQNDDSSSFVGAAYLFERDGMGVWEQVAYLKADNADLGDRFGAFLDLDGERAIVGAWSEDSDSREVDGDGTNDDAPGSGAAYVFARDTDGDWFQEAYLKAANSNAGDEFGSAVAISGRTAAVGAPREDGGSAGIDGDASSNDLSAAGAVYLFEADDDGNWSQTAYVKASNVDAGDFFGASIALDGDRLAVGAPGESSSTGDPDDDTADGSGAVYVFERDESGAWSEVAYLKADDPDVNDAFGLSVALAGDVLVVGAPGDGSASLGPEGDPADDSAPDAGAVYVFARNEAGEWQRLAYLKASNTDPGDELGSSVAFDGDTVVAGAPFEDGGDTGVDGDDSDDSVADAGAVYVIR